VNTRERQYPEIRFAQFTVALPNIDNVPLPTDWELPEKILDYLSESGE
jgi:hypothetical protein